MLKFSFFKNNGETKIAANGNGKKQRRFLIDIDQMEAEKSHSYTNQLAQENKKKRSRQFQDLDRPYAIMVGDPKSHLSNLPGGVQAHYEAVHRTFPGYGKDEEGRVYSHELKKSLRHPQSGYKRIMLSEDQYAHDPDLVNLARNYPGKRGLEAYVPTNTNITRSTNTSKEKLMSIVQFGKSMDRLRNRTSEVPSLNTPEFEPTDPLNLIATHGGKAALEAMYTDKYPFATQKEEGENLCVCGRPGEKHVDKEEARNHFAKTGEHLEIHKFAPQSEDNNARASNSPLLSIATPRVGEDGNVEMRFEQPGNSLWNIIKKRKENALLKNGVTDASELKEQKYMPSVRIGTKAIKFNRVTGVEPLRGPDGRKFTSYQQTQKAETQMCTNCTRGKLNPMQRDRKVHCEDCLPNKINMITDKDTSGNDTLRPYTVGLGGGRQKYIYDKDVPPCKFCEGKGFRTSRDKSSTEEKIPCRACNTSGLTPGLKGEGATGFACGNCNSADSSISITPNNTCPNCENGVVGVRLKKKSRQWKLLTRSESFEGNPRFLTHFDTTGHANTGVDTWKAHGDKDCTRCHGDDEYQTNNGLPCNCRIAKFDDNEKLHSPSNARYIFPGHIDVPEHIYQKALVNAFKDNPDANPHDSIQMPHAIDPKTGLTPHEQYEGLGTHFDMLDGGHKIPVGAEKFLGYWSNGVSLPKEMLNGLQQRSAERRKSKNAKYCAASGDLEDIENTLTQNFSSLPINVPGQRKKVKVVKKHQLGRVDTSTFHPNVQPIIPKVEHAISSLKDPDASRYSEPLDKLYQEASHISHDRKINGTDESTHWDAYNDAFNKVISTVSRFHGEEKAKEVVKALSGLPQQRKVTTPDESPALEESQNV